jgi:hypothetical protein
MADRAGLTDKCGWRVVLAAYLLFYLGIIVWARGIPYAIDNNESFSSLEHARNLHEVSWKLTKGLTDEVAAFTPSASPFIHSHQGNVPRIFAYLIYLLGARSVESQIAITTFTVGLCAIFFAYRYLRTIGPPVFAMIGCLVLTTDYGLFGQWQVDTYRVWYGFFFFSSLLWIHSFQRGSGWKIPVWGLCNYAAMFYGEYVYATFMAVTSALYACFIYRRNWGSIFRIVFIQCAGALIAAGTLLAQLTAYMGWHNVLLDIHYTLSARNMAFDQSFADEANRFYAQHHIVFFQNFLDTSTYRNVPYFVRSLFKFHFQYYSAPICLSFLIVLAAAIIGCCRLGHEGRTRHPTSSASVALKILGLSALAFGFFILVDSGLHQFDIFPAGTTASTMASAAIAACSLVSVLAVAQPTAAGISSQIALPWAGIFRAALLLGLSVYLIDRRKDLFGSFIENQWPFFGSASNISKFSVVVLVLCTVVALSISVNGAGESPSRVEGFPKLFALSACVLLGFAASYRIFTGYIFSGYLYRQAPFLVFWSDILFAAALFLILEETRRGLRVHHPILVLSASTLFVFLFGSWVSLQMTYGRLVAPTHYSFLHLLSKAPYRGKTFVADTYAAPIAEQTHAWAYAESSIFSGAIKLTADGFVTEHDKKYLWFGDAENNKKYLEPEYGIKIAQPASILEALDGSLRSENEAIEPIAFASFGCIARSLDPLQAFVEDQVVASDGIHFTIVKFDWDYPPFLQPVDNTIARSALHMSLQQRMAVSRVARAFHRHWRIELESMASSLSNGPEPLNRLISSATVDGKAVFSAAELNGDAPVSQLVDGDKVQLVLKSGLRDGRLRVAINEMSHIFDLRNLKESESSISCNRNEPYGNHTSIPNFPAGIYVNTRLVRVGSGSAAEIQYNYKQQNDKGEEHTTVRLYNWSETGKLKMVDAVLILGPRGIPIRIAEFRRRNPDTLMEYARISARGDIRNYEHWLLDHLTAHPDELSRPGILGSEAERLGLAAKLTSGETSGVTRMIPLPEGLSGWSQISVTPGTATKDGPEYFGLPFSVEDFERNSSESKMVGIGTPRADKGPIPYGVLEMRLRFSPFRGITPEPLVSTGIEDAGDFVYVTYPDPAHIRIGLDHWFHGGPLSQPIRVDFSREHKIEISMGSLFPSSEDFIFEGLLPEKVAKVKHSLLVVFDGETVLDAVSDFYESTPDQVSVGANLIKGTTSSTEFKGEIIEDHRVWPELLSTGSRTK